MSDVKGADAEIAVEGVTSTWKNEVAPNWNNSAKDLRQMMREDLDRWKAAPVELRPLMIEDLERLRQLMKANLRPAIWEEVSLRERQLSDSRGTERQKTHLNVQGFVGKRHRVGKRERDFLGIK